MRTPRIFRSTNRFLAALAVGALFALPFGAARASTQERLDLTQLMSQSDLVFEGTVVAIEHRNADVVETGDAALPHTFVTFAVADALKGTSSAGEYVTLRFLGGPDGKGRVLEIPGVPQFALGDRDVLFVRNEKSMVCPIVGLEGGRFRVIRGEVFDALGNATWMAPDGRFVSGDTEIDLTKAGYPELPTPSEAHDAAEHHAGDPAMPPEGSIRPDAEGLKRVLRVQQTALALAGKSSEGTEFRSARISETFRFPRLRAVVLRGLANAVAPVKPVDRKVAPEATDGAK